MASSFPRSVAGHVIHVLEEFRASVEIPSLSLVDRPKVSVWQASLAPRIKINTDAAFDSASGNAAFGVLASVSDGAILFTAQLKEARVEDPVHAEERAIRFGLTCAIERGLNQIELEQTPCWQLSFYKIP
ncbi:hypothetical protein PTKIN_Ptkin07bG0243300 [Pterospermum kingtungense]